MEFYTVEEVMAKLRINKATTYKLLRSRKMPSLKAGRQWRIPKEKFDEWIIRQVEKVEM